jgi:hypothetical protein
MRLPFTDGANSFWHVFFGAVATQSMFIGILFTLYQFWDIFEKNMLVDMFEFFCGYGVCAAPQMYYGLLHW